MSTIECFNIHLASLTTPTTLTVYSIPSVIFSTNLSSSYLSWLVRVVLLGQLNYLSSLIYRLEGLQVKVTSIDLPAGTSPSVTLTRKTFGSLRTHLNLALALPLLVSLIYSDTSIYSESSGNQNLNSFLESSMLTGSI